MAPSHIQLLLVVGGAMALVAITKPDAPLFWPLLLGGCALLGLALHFHRMARRRRSTIAAVIARRSAELTRRAWRADQRLVVPFSGELAFRIILYAILGAAVLTFLSVILAMVAGLHLAIIAPALIGYLVLLVLGPAADFGKPALIMDSSGVRVSGYGPVPWSTVDGVALDVTHRRDHKDYWLLFRVPTIGEGGTPTPWLQRVLARFGIGALRQKIIRARLTADPEHPIVVEAVAKHLWKQATGRSDSWDPAMPAEELAAWRRWQRLLQRSQDLAPTVEAVDQAIAARPESADALLVPWLENERELRQAYENYGELEAGAKVRAARRRAVIAVGVALIAVLAGVAGMIHSLNTGSSAFRDAGPPFKVFAAISVFGVFLLLLGILAPMWQSVARKSSAEMPENFQRPSAKQRADFTQRLEKERVDLYTD